MKCHEIRKLCAQFWPCFLSLGFPACHYGQFDWLCSGQYSTQNQPNWGFCFFCLKVESPLGPSTNASFSPAISFWEGEYGFKCVSRSVVITSSTYLSSVRLVMSIKKLQRWSCNDRWLQSLTSYGQVDMVKSAPCGHRSPTLCRSHFYSMQKALYIVIRNGVHFVSQQFM